MDLQAIISGLIRHALTAGGGSAITSGLLSGNTVNLIAGTIVSVIGVVWSIWDKQP
jgi:hypothetical protein